MENHQQLAYNALLSQKIDLVKAELRKEILKEVRTLTTDVESLQDQVNRPRNWFQDASVVVALLAVVFSTVTAAATYFQVENQNRLAARNELRELLQRLASIPIDHAEIQKDYENKPEILINLSSVINTEMALVLSQAVEVAERFPRDITAIEYASIGEALSMHGYLDQVQRFLDAGLKRSQDLLTEQMLLRNYANYFFIIGEPDNGREKYKQAMNSSIFEKYGSPGNEYFIESSRAFTEIRWAQSELFHQGTCREALKLLSEAENRLENLPEDDFTDSLKDQVQYNQEFIERNSDRSCK